MEKRRERKNELRREQRIKTRKDALCMEYIRLKHSKIYDEANEVYNALNLKYPEKFDLRKTDEIKNIQPEPAPEFQDPPNPWRLKFGKHFILKDNISLRIPLMSQPKTSKTEIPTPDITEVEQQGDTEEAKNTETIITEVVQEGFQIPEMSIDAIPPSLIDELDSQLLHQIIDELRGDIDLDSIMNSIEDYDMDMDMY